MPCPLPETNPNDYLSSGSHRAGADSLGRVTISPRAVTLQSYEPRGVPMPKPWWPNAAPYPQQPMNHLVTFELLACIEYARLRLKDDKLLPDYRTSYEAWLSSLLAEQRDRDAIRAKFTAQAKVG
jgi:hypothetical protein